MNEFTQLETNEQKRASARPNPKQTSLTVWSIAWKMSVENVCGSLFGLMFTLNGLKPF